MNIAKLQCKSEIKVVKEKKKGSREEMKKETQQAIAMVDSIREKFMLTKSEACDRLGISRVHYGLWIRGDYEISNRVYKRMLLKFEDFKNDTDNTALIHKLQSQITDIQNQINTIIGK